jgi:hypothetical protein
MPTRVVYYAAMSLDGRISGPDHDLSFLKTLSSGPEGGDFPGDEPDAIGDLLFGKENANPMAVDIDFTHGPHLSRFHRHGQNEFRCPWWFPAAMRRG